MTDVNGMTLGGVVRVGRELELGRGERAELPDPVRRFAGRSTRSAWPTSRR